MISRNELFAAQAAAKLLGFSIDAGGADVSDYTDQMTIEYTMNLDVAKETGMVDGVARVAGDTVGLRRKIVCTNYEELLAAIRQIGLDLGVISD
jgi:hypothetical protein